MARTQIGTGRITIDMSIERDDKGALCLTSNLATESSTGLKWAGKHEMTERDEISADGKKYRRVGAAAIEIPRIGKNGVIDGTVRKFGKVDTEDNRPFYDKVVGHTKIGGKTVTDGALTIARSLGNTLYDQVIYSILFDGVESTSNAEKAPAVIGKVVLDSYEADLDAMIKNLSALPNAVDMAKVVWGYTGTATTMDAIKADMMAAKAEQLRAEWEAKKAASDAKVAAKTVEGAKQNAEVLAATRGSK